MRRPDVRITVHLPTGETYPVTRAGLRTAHARIRDPRVRRWLAARARYARLHARIGTSNPPTEAQLDAAARAVVLARRAAKIPADMIQV